MALIQGDRQQQNTYKLFNVMANKRPIMNFSLLNYERLPYLINLSLSLSFSLSLSLSLSLTHTHSVNFFWQYHYTKDIIVKRSLLFSIHLHTTVWGGDPTLNTHHLILLHTYQQNMTEITIICYNVTLL